MLAPFALAMTLYALANVLVGFHLSRGETRYAWILAAAVPVQLAVLALVPGGIDGLVWANVAVGRWRCSSSHELFVGSSVPALRVGGAPPARAAFRGPARGSRGRARRSSARRRSPACSRGRSPRELGSAFIGSIGADASGGDLVALAPAAGGRLPPLRDDAPRPRRRAVRLPGVERRSTSSGCSRTTPPTSPRPSSARWRRTTSSSSRVRPLGRRDVRARRGTSAARRSWRPGRRSSTWSSRRTSRGSEHASLLHFEVLALPCSPRSPRRARPSLVGSRSSALRVARRLAHVRLLRRDGGDRRRARSRSARRGARARGRRRALVVGVTAAASSRRQSSSASSRRSRASRCARSASATTLDLAVYGVAPARARRARRRERRPRRPARRVPVDARSTARTRPRRATTSASSRSRSRSAGSRSRRRRRRRLDARRRDRRRRLARRRRRLAALRAARARGVFGSVTWTPSRILWEVVPPSACRRGGSR